MRRKRKPRPSIIPEDTYFFTAEQLRKLMAYSRHYFYKYVLPMGEFYGIPSAVVLGSTDLEHLRWRADELYTLRPDLSPYPKDSCWLDRFRQRQRTDREAYLASKQSTAQQVAA